MKKNALYCPIFNDQNIFLTLQQPSLPLDLSGLFRPLEMILFPDQRLLTNRQDSETLKILYPEHSKDQHFYALKRFFGPYNLEDQIKHLPSPKIILANLLSYEGLPYLWGGNWILKEEDMDELNQIYFDQTDAFRKNLSFLFSGLDCSGLLYAATHGFTPRNTCQLVKFGKSLPIEKLNITSILKQIKPLDIIVWKGHVLIFLDKTQLIESRHGFGVVIVDAAIRLAEICQNKTPSNIPHDSGFVINRWLDS